jgi:hypothetical protein
MCFNKTWMIWFRLTFISLFTPPHPHHSHNSSMPPLHPRYSSNILYLVKVRHYSYNGTSAGRLSILYIPKTWPDLLLFLRNDSAGRSLLLYIPKTSLYFHYFFSETIVPGIQWVRTKNSGVMQENVTLRNDASNIITHCL